LCIEIIWATALSGAAVFSATYALRMGATNTDIGLLSSIPALITVLLSIPIGRFIQSRRKRFPWVLGSLTVHRTGYILLALVPFLHIAGVSPGLVIVLTISALNIPAIMANNGFMDAFASVVPVDRRASVMVVRNILSAGAVSLCIFLFGAWLELPNKGSPWSEWFAFPRNYQIMFVFACIVVQLSVFYLMKIKPPAPRVGSPRVEPAVSSEGAPVVQKSLGERLRSLWAFGKSQPNFLRLTGATLLHAFGLWAIGPLGIIFLVRKLGASDGWIGLNNTLASAIGILGWLAARWIIPRWGEQNTLKRLAPFLGLLSVLMALSPSLTPILGVTFLSSLLSPSFSLSQTNLLLKVMPENNRPDYYAIWATATSLGAFVCPLIGVSLTNVFGVAPVIIGGGLLSSIAGFAFWVLPVKIEED
jgi:hypothetical protein